MKSNKDYIDSGILEQYVLGNCSQSETQEIEKKAAEIPEIRNEIDAISKALNTFALANSIEPNMAIKPFLLATIDYSERLKNGEPVSYPPELNENSSIDDYSFWLNRADMISPGEDPLFAKIIGFTPEATTAIVWIKDFAPQEVHDNEFEKFLIIEGTCNIIIGEEVNQLVPGDYFAIPLYKKHLVKVTSGIPCKVILQRIAA